MREGKKKLQKSKDDWGELVWHSVIEKETDSVKRITIRSNRVH